MTFRDGITRYVRGSQWADLRARRIAEHDDIQDVRSQRTGPGFSSPFPGPHLKPVAAVPQAAATPPLGD